MNEKLQAQAPAPLGKVLVVDDNEDNSNLLSRRLRRQGYEVDVANDGPSSLEACEKTRYDAVILDVMMPGMSGLEVLERLRKTSSTTELLIIMATAKTDSVDVIDALKRGANDYVTKPIDFPVLMARLEAQLMMQKEAAKRAGSVIDVTIGIETGTVIDGRYEIVDKQGEGGFAVVYRATQLSTGQEVALKHARPDVMRADEEGVHVERFKREVALIGQLNHPHVVRLIDSGSIPVRRAGRASSPSEAPPTRADGIAAAVNAATERGPKDDASRTRRRPSSEGDKPAIEVPYLVMEFLRGESLAELIAREAPLDPARTIEIALPVIGALAAAHAQGVIHRDIKPSNIMLVKGAEGSVEPKVLDFGIAKLSEPEGRALTVSASLIGTPQYMSPEQARGQKNVDVRADQFALASVIYEMLTGRCLYSGEGFLELVAHVLSANHTPIGQLRPDLPADLVEVLSKALSPSREDRFVSMRSFGRALLPHAPMGVAQRWRDVFTESTRLPPPDPPATTSPPTKALTPSSSSAQVKISTPDESPGVTDATVAFPVGNLVTPPEPVKPPPAPTPRVEATETLASVLPPAAPAAPEPPANIAPAAAPAPTTTAAKVPWLLLAVVFVVGIVVAKACL